MSPPQWFARRAHGAAAIGLACVAMLMSGCSGGSEQPAPSRTPSPAGSVGAAVGPDEIQRQLLTDLQAESWGIEPAAWKRMNEFATSLPWRLVSAAGVQQAAACTGQGAPTVVYVNGWGSPAVPFWMLAADAQAAHNRVCVFDRPGGGLSPPRTVAAGHSSPEKHGGEMLAMLAVLDEPGPYLLVAWSYGGLVARAAGTKQSDAVAGMVLVDAVSPLMTGLDEPLSGEQGIVDTDTIATSVGSGPNLGKRPVIVLEAGLREEAEGFDPAEWSQLQRQAATISRNSVHAIVEDSHHDIPVSNPAAVVAATNAVAESIRAANAALAACPEALAASGSTCVDQ